MMRSLSSGVAGLRAHQTKMDVIGNNIANVNTYGYKSSRVTFSDVYYQTLSSGSAPVAGVTGGTNPTQIGYGAAVATIDVLNTQSGLSSTDRALDLYINGDGMIAVKDSSGNLLFTRLGITGFDAEGNLVDANGNFIMGFPMNDDGTPRINPDGTVDVENLVPIKVDKDLLDEITNISIGTTGEITGTMAGDTEITISSKKPDWLTDVQIDPNSNVVGDVRVVMEYISSTTATPASWISSVTCATNSKIQGTYTFEYDPDTKQIIATSTTGDVLTGTYKKGGTVDLVNASGKVMMTLTTDKYESPLNTVKTVIGSSTFDLKQILAVEYTDKGGNKIRQEAEYDEISTQVTLGDITLVIDPDSAKSVTTQQLKYDVNNAFATGTDAWLQGVTLNPNASYAGSKLSLAAGVSRAVGKSYTGYAFLNFMNNATGNAAIDSMIKAIDVLGQYKISTVDEDPSDPKAGYKFQITDRDGNVVATSDVITKAGDQVTFTVGGETYNLGTVGAEQFKASASTGNLGGFSSKRIQELLAKSNVIGDYSLSVAANGADYDVTITDSEGNPVGSTVTVAAGDPVVIDGVNLGTLDIATFPAGTNTVIGKVERATNLNDASFVNLSEKNTLQLKDGNGTVVEEVVYNGSSTVKLGDLSIKVDKDKLMAYFGNRPKIEDASSTVDLGTLSQDTTKDWIFDGMAANAQAGIGQVVTIGNIALAKIPNMVAMEQSGSSYFVTTANSGEATFVRPGVNGTGTLKSGYLEMSNVDISKEFTDMIVTQRGFQANTRIITVSDEMLNELVNLKR